MSDIYDPTAPAGELVLRKEGGDCMEDKFPARLRALRREKGVSCKVVGDFCGLSQTQIRRYERGLQQPTLGIIIKLARYFEVSADDLIGIRKNF